MLMAFAISNLGKIVTYLKEIVISQIYKIKFEDFFIFVL